MNNINEAIKIQLRFDYQLRWVTEVLCFKFRIHAKRVNYQGVLIRKDHRILIFMLSTLSFIFGASIVQLPTRSALVQKPIATQYIQHHTLSLAVSSIEACPTPAK